MVTEKERINVDFHNAEEIALLREFKARAMRRGKRILESLIEIIRADLGLDPKKK